MLVPHRTFSSPEYRYGFNGKEKDDDVKGSGMQYDYGFRIYDNRLGKFLSTDPLFKGYPFYTPYQFAGNKPIVAIDLDGLEEEYKYNVYAGMKAASRPGMEGMSYKETRDIYIETVNSHKFLSSAPDEVVAAGVGLGITVALDFYFTKGQASKFLLKQLGTQLAVNATVGGITYIFTGKFNPKEIVNSTFSGFDLADGGIDKLADIVIDKYKIGKIKIAIKAVAPSLFDVTYKNGIQFVGVNKDARTIVTDIIGNILTSGIETKLKDNNIEIPTIKLSASKEADVIGTVIIDGLDAVIKKESESVKLKDLKKEVKKRNPKRKVKKEFYEIKKDNIPKG